MKIRKYYPHNSVLFVTFSLEQGLLLLANPLCEAIIKSCLATAQAKFPVTISAFLINGNHVHLILVVQDPANISKFIKYFKTESAHMLNRVLGRNKRTVWCKGFDSPIILTPIRTLIALTYIYANPAKDDLEVSIDKFPGLSSWNMFIKKEYIKSFKRVRRYHFRALAKDSHNLRGYTKEAERILSEAKRYNKLILDPDAWMKAFKIINPLEIADINNRIVERVKTLESRASNVRERLGKSVMGRDKLINQPLNTTYLSKRSGKRTACLSDDISLRVEFISFLKDLYQRASDVLERWKFGDFSLPFPPGLFPPCMPKLAEPIGLL